MNQTAQSDRIIPLVMCGGAGTRLWPSVSVKDRPKQFLPLLGSRSTFQETMLRVSDAAVFARPIIITNNQYRFIVKDQLSEIGIEADILLEPMRRDPGPAIAAGAVFAATRESNPVLVALAADHVVTDKARFRCSLPRSGEARRGKGASLPSVSSQIGPATEYGYICPGATAAWRHFYGRAFRRKAGCKDRAGTYIEQGYLWNSGNFVFAADDLLAEYSAFETATVTAAKAAIRGRRKRSWFHHDRPGQVSAARKRHPSIMR